MLSNVSKSLTKNRVLTEFILDGHLEHAPARPLAHHMDRVVDVIAAVQAAQALALGPNSISSPLAVLATQAPSTACSSV